MGKRIEHVELFVVFNVDHVGSLQHTEIARICIVKARQTQAKQIVLQAISVGYLS